MKSQDSVEHAQRFDELLLAGAPLTQLLEGDKAVLVDIDLLHQR